MSNAVESAAVLRAMTTVADWQLANPSAHKAYEWQGAPFWAGLYELAVRSSRRQKYLDAIRRNGESIQWQPGPGRFLADDHAVTQSYFLLYGLGADRRMIEPALAWSALVRAVRPSGKLGYVQRVGDQPGDTGPEQTEIYGVGAFLLAGSEVFRLTAR